MPRYFFHLTFGDRVVPDEEGIDLTSRAAARDEAIAAARELSERTSASPRSRWASWFLQVADEQGPFLRVPLGYPALEVVSADNPAIEVAAPGPQARPVIAPAEVAAKFPTSHNVLAVVRRALARRRDMHALLEKNRQLQQQLADQFELSKTARVRAAELVRQAQAAYSQAIELQACRGAPPYTAPAHTVEGGGER